MKAYTDLNQSKKLAKILPLESADMFWLITGNTPRVHVLTDSLSNYRNWENYPCWSLAALLDILKDNIKIEKTQLDQSNMFTYSIIGDGYDYRTYEHEELIDAAFDMIITLHEHKLIK
jgi:hypothetical protein